MKIHISIKGDNQIQLDLSPEVTWNIALRALSATILNLANKTVDAAFNEVASKSHLTKVEKATLRDEIKGDVADEINCAISSVLTTLVPDTPTSKLTEVAIATLENEIIHYACDNHITLDQAIQDYQNKLKEHPYAAKSDRFNTTSD